MKHETIELKRTGYRIYGKSTIKLWNGSVGEVIMNPVSILGKISKKDIIESINDGGFGCKKILSAELVIYKLWECGFETYNRDMCIDISGPQPILM